MSIETEAATKRIELTLGLISKDDVIAWADRIILDQKDPPVILYDISLAARRSCQEITDVLRSLSGTLDVPDSTKVFRLFAARLRDNLQSAKSTPDEVAALPYELAWKMDIELPDEYACFCSYADELFPLVREGHMEREAAKRALGDFLHKVLAEEKA